MTVTRSRPLWARRIPPTKSLRRCATCSLLVNIPTSIPDPFYCSPGCRPTDPPKDTA